MYPTLHSRVWETSPTTNGLNTFNAKAPSEKIAIAAYAELDQWLTRQPGDKSICLSRYSMTEEFYEAASGSFINPVNLSTKFVIFFGLHDSNAAVMFKLTFPSAAQRP